MRLIDGDELYQKVVGYNGGAVDKTVAKRLIDQMPTVDAVSRQAVIDLCDWYDNPSMHDDLEKLPSAQPERKRGEWIKDGNKWMCDKCGELVYDDDHNFCPNCGSYNGGEEDG